MPLRVYARRPAPARSEQKAAAAAAAMPYGLPSPPKEWPQPPSGISLCMIVKNEERFLEQCLRSVAGIVDEINIVDTGSTDRTVEIAQRFGARIEHREWRNDFGWARNEALAMATKRWVLQLDADEELAEESRAELLALKAVPGHLTGVWIRCANASDKYRGGGNVSHAIVRIFPNTPRIRYHGAIHEFPSLDGSAMTLTSCTSPIRIVHHGYLNEIVDGRDKYTRNMEIVEAECESEPEEPFHWYNYGMTAFLGGDSKRGAEGFERMWELCRKHGMRGFTPNGVQTLADIYTEHLHQPEKGLQYALECLKLAPRYANAHFSAGKALTELGRYDEARRMFELAIADGEFVDRQFIVDDEVPVWKAQCEIGSSYVAQGNDAAAIEWFERGLRNRPAIEPLRINYGRSLERLSRFDEAEAVFRAVYEDFSGEQPALEYTNYLLRRHQDREALQIIEESQAQLPPHVAVQMLLAAAAVMQRNGWGDGEAYLGRALELDPENREISAMQQLRRFNSLLALQQYGDALTAAQQGLELAPDDARLKYSAAIACANLSRKDEALAYVEHIVPEHGDAYPLAAYLRGAVLREFGRTAEALKVLEQLLAVQPKHVDAVALYAAILESENRIGDAEVALKSALAFGKHRIAADLSQLYVRAGRLEDAKEIALAALR